MGKVIAMKRVTFSMEQANSLFNRECMAICGKDCISVNRAKCILNDESVDYGCKVSKAGAWWNVFGCGVFGGGLKYLTYRGFIEAVGFYNVMQEYLCEVVNNDTDTGKSNE